MCNHIQSPTHARGHQLDVFLTRIEHPPSSVRVDPPSIVSDHSLIIVTIEGMERSPRLDDRIYRRCWKRFDADIFAADLSSTALLRHPPTDVDELFQCYDETLLELLNKHAPLRAVSYRASPGAPWYDADCRRMKTLTRKLEKRFRSHKSAETRASWKYQFGEQRKLFQSKYASYWSNVITSCQGNSKALWAKMRRLLDLPTSLSSVLSASALSNYFDTKISKIRASTSMAPPPLIAPRSIADHLRTFRPTNEDEIAELLHRAPPKQ